MSWLETSFSTWSAGGLLLIPLAMVSFMIFALILKAKHAISFLIKQLMPISSYLEGTELSAEGLIAFLNAQGNLLSKTYQRAIDRILKEGAGMAVLEEIELKCVDLQRKDEVILAAFTAAAPLIGLLGTVMGMIGTFDAVSQVGGETGKTMADGISSALITTQFGLVVALPGVFGIAHLHKKISELETRLTQCRFLMLNVLNR